MLTCYVSILMQYNGVCVQMLLCDQCNGECHMYCLYPPLYTVPSGTWLCPHCDQVCIYASPLTTTILVFHTEMLGSQAEGITV